MEKSLSLPAIIQIIKQHHPYAILSSLGLALLYAEEGWASYNFWPQRSMREALVLMVMITSIAFIGYMISFFVPPLLVTETWDHPRAWGIFSNVTAWSVGITITLNIIELGILLYLVNFDLVASYNLLRDIYLYTFVAMLFFHGLLLYVRYMHYLYEKPDRVQPLKVIAASAGVGILIILISGFVFLLDFYHLENIPVDQQGMLGLHIYVRALYLFTLSLASYAWHLRWIADH